jgi:hypothetical protein
VKASTTASCSLSSLGGRVSLPQMHQQSSAPFLPVDLMIPFVKQLLRPALAPTLHWRNQLRLDPSIRGNRSPYHFLLDAPLLLRTQTCVCPCIVYMDSACASSSGASPVVIPGSIVDHLVVDVAEYPLQGYVHQPSYLYNRKSNNYPV